MRRVFGEGKDPLMALDADVEAAESGRGMFIVGRVPEEEGCEGSNGCEIDEGSCLPLGKGLPSEELEGDST